MKPRHIGSVALLMLALVASVDVNAQPATAAPSTAAPAATNGIETMLVTQQGGNTVVKLTLRQPLAAVPANFSVANPARVVFDFPDTVNALGRSSQQINEGELRTINVVQVGDRTRLVLNLKSMGNYETRMEGNAFFVTLTPSSIGEATATSAVQHFAETKASDSHAVRDLKFRRGKAGEGLITVDLSDPNVGIDVKQQGANLVVDIQKSVLPENLRRRLDVTDFATPVTTVTASSQGENARIVIVPTGLWEHTAYQSDNQFVVEVKPLKEDPKKVFQGSQRQGYQGEKVSLNFQNIPLRELLHVFADITNFNIVISDTVSGNVSLRLNDVPWDQALDIVLQQKGLSMRKNGNVVWIAPSDELAAREKLELESKQVISDLEPVRTETFQLNYQKADAVGRMLLGAPPPATSGGASAALPPGIKPMKLISERGSVGYDTRTNKLFITDSPTRLGDIRRLITEIDVPVRQVLIEARIVEADNSFSKQLGVRIGGADHYGLDVGRRVLGVNGTRVGFSASAVDAQTHLPDNYTQAVNGVGGVGFPAYTYNVDGKATREVTSSSLADSQFVNLAAANPAGQFALTLFNSAKSALLTLELSAMESDGKGKTISSPRVLTADQVEATIEDGKEIPYWSASSSGATTVSYRKATLSLKVRPQITPDGRVIMNLQVNKDSVDPALSTSYGIAINTKNVTTQVLVENGGTVVIGGIYVQEERKVITRVPLLGDLPYVGFMFRNTDSADNRSELLIFITPKIVSETLTLR